MNAVTKLTPLICLISIMVSASPARSEDQATLDKDEIYEVLESDSSRAAAWLTMARDNYRRDNSYLEFVACVRYLTLDPTGDNSAPVANRLWEILIDQMDQKNESSDLTEPASNDVGFAQPTLTDAGTAAKTMQAGQMASGNAPPMPVSPGLSVTDSESTSPSPRRLLRRALKGIPERLDSIDSKVEEEEKHFSHVALFFETARDDYSEEMLKDILRVMGDPRAKRWTENHSEELQEYREWAREWQDGRGALRPEE